jgi:membrane-associated phospholipid phosphatase
VRLSFMLAAAIVYSAVVGLEALWHGVVATPDMLLIALMPLALLTGRFVTWLKDWVPFVGLLLGWEAMRSIADTFSVTGVHYGSLRPELALFGGWLPEIWLQNILYHAPYGSLLNTITASIDLLHFPAVIAMAFIIWLQGRPAFLIYSGALFATALAAFAIFLLLPTAPPWYAMEHGAIGGLQHVMIQVMPVKWSTYYQSLNPNPVAANPSLHAAFPFVGFLSLLRLRSWLAWPLLAWCVAVWFSVIYLGEHYVLDIVGGVALGWLCHQLVVTLVRAYGHRKVEPVGGQGEADVARREAWDSA